MTAGRGLGLLFVASLIGSPCAVGTASAQALARSAVVGHVTDPSGLPVAGAQVTVAGPTLFGGHVSSASGAQGEYRVGGLPPGSYDIDVVSAGFEPVARRQIPLPADTTYVIDVKLSLAPISDQVDVAAEAPVIDVRTSGITTTFDRHLLETLPTDRTLRSILNLAPGVTADVAFGGAAETSNVFAIDGVRLMEPYFGGQAVRVGYTWADQVQVRALGAPAEQGPFTGAVANAILRSGSNRYSGLAEFVAAVPGWTADNTKGLPADLRTQFTPLDTLASWELSTQAGGPIVKDRLWFFSGLTATRDQYRPFGYSGPASTAEWAPRWIAKLDAAPASHVRLQGFYSHDGGKTTAAGLGAFTTIEASGDERQDNHTWSAGATWTPDSQTVVEVRNGGFTGESRLDPRPPASRGGPPPRYDLETGISSDNVIWWYATGSTATTTAASVERLAHRWGEHQLKAGVESEYTATSEDQGYPAGLWFFDQAGVPVQVQAWDGYTEHTTTRRTSLFVQDRWTVGRFTFEPGVRFEMNRGSVPGQPVVFTTSPVGWRVGAAWDVTPSHRTVLRVHHGRYFDPVFNYLYAFNDVTGLNEIVTYDISESGEWTEADRSLDTSGATMLPDMKQARVDQFVADVERQVTRDLALELRYVHRAFRDYIGYVDPLLSEAIPVSVPDPGPDGALNTADDAGPITVYRSAPGDHPLELGNIPGAWRDYDAVQLIARRRLANRWQGQASYTWSRSTGTLPNLANSNTGGWGASPSGVGTNPNFNSSRPGDIKPVYDFSEVKVLGVYDAPWLGGFTVSGIARWQNGRRWERLFLASVPPFGQIRAERRGSRRAPSFGTLDLRVEKQVPLGHGRRAGVYVDAFNATNVGKPLAFLMMSGASFGQPRAWTDPRTVRIGARFTF